VADVGVIDRPGELCLDVGYTPIPDVPR